ncbi:hypothetical protein CEUSTIGMA_g2904.t1 [Chlamydomonas eustigma]|uniref:Ribosome production factor 2 homolog n=1 Tax=Chlamydomonas eustigma TaxID=1157962 RepID=A0A250WXC0_9CHLO|nr:hypothetical protein CEUSTIGMA_g2904.t1 [Chlamydomonas eustigma]|eukprot:GAX75461.1 hypothetical protein CEUSTIGMA_g2904.t1 [Chlamydomonas eustigma]
MGASKAATLPATMVASNKKIKIPKIGGESLAPSAPALKLITAKTRRGRRILDARAPKAIEDAKKSLVLYGNKTSQVIKEVLTDLHKVKRTESVKFTRKNENVKPFEPGGESSLEFYCQKIQCGLFALGSHSKKRPHNLVLGRIYDGHLYDCVELGVEQHKTLQSFASAGTGAQLGSKPCIIFVGEKFESLTILKQLKSTLLDYFRGEQVGSINLAGLDRVVMATALTDTLVLLRQYTIKLKKSGTRVPRIVLREMGPSLDLTVRRHRAAPAELEKEACKQPKLGKKKEKNVGSDLLSGKVGRIYMPKQKVDTMALSKMKGLKRERRQATGERKQANAKSRLKNGRPLKDTAEEEE